MTCWLPPSLVEKREGKGSKIGAVLALLASDNDGEALGAVRALNRMLASESCDIHRLVSHVEEAGPTIACALRLGLDQGKAQGRAEAAASQRGAREGKSRKSAVALAVVIAGFALTTSLLGPSTPSTAPLTPAPTSFQIGQTVKYDGKIYVYKGLQPGVTDPYDTRNWNIGPAALAPSE